MLLERDKLNDHILKKIKQVAPDQDTCKKIYDKCFDLFNVPKGITSDYLALRTPIESANNIFAYALLKSIEEVTGKKSTIPTYFTQQEIEEYDAVKFEKPTLKFPLVFKMIQVTEDQWIGKITYKELALFRNAQLINYNPATQRPLTSLKLNDTTMYVPSINPTSLKEIKHEMEQNTYIPTAITLNIPEDAAISFGYDEKKNIFVIDQIPQKENGEFLYHLDIVDGYHRFLAGCTLNATLNEFDYPMEFRIVNFSQEKARRFIFQEDKQTKMKPVEAASYDPSSAANRVVAKLNERGNIAGMIGTKDSLIYDSDLAEVIKFFFFKKRNYKSEEERILIIQTANELRKKFDILTEYDVKYLTQKYSMKALLTIMTAFVSFGDEPKLPEIIDKAIPCVEAYKDRKLTNVKPSKPVIELIESIIKEAMKDV